MFAKDLRQLLAAEIQPQAGMQKEEEMRSIWIVMMFGVEPMRCYLNFAFNGMVEDRGVISINAAV
jgi:hypothetical protein